MKVGAALDGNVASANKIRYALSVLQTISNNILEALEHDVVNENECWSSKTELVSIFGMQRLW